MSCASVRVLASKSFALKRRPSLRKSELDMVARSSSKAWSSMTAKKMPKRVGARTQHCLTPFVIGNESPPACTLPNMPSWNWRTMCTNLSGQPHLRRIDHSASRLTVSKALVRWEVQSEQDNAFVSIFFKRKKQAKRTSSLQVITC